MKTAKPYLLHFFLLLGLCAGSAPLRAEIPARQVAAEGAARQGENENDPEFYLQLIGNMQEKKLYFASIAHLDAFDLRWPGDSRAALLRGDALREVGYLDRARAIYQNMLKTAQSAGAYHGLGIVASRQGDSAGALVALVKANQLAPTSSAILNDLGYAQLLAGQLDDARLSLHKASELEPKNGRVGANLALLYGVIGQLEKAQSIMNWYQFPEAQRQEISRKAGEIAYGREKKMLDSVKLPDGRQKIDRVEAATPSLRE